MIVLFIEHGNFLNIMDVLRLLGLSRSFRSVGGVAAQQPASCTD